MYRIFLLFVTVVALGVAPVCQAQEAVRIGYNPIRISLPLLVAKERGFFKDAGIEVTLERYDTPQPMMEALAAGRLPLAGYSAMPIIYSILSRSKTPVRFTTAVLEDSTHQFAYLVARNDPAAPRSVTALRGKRVAVLPTVAFQRWFDALLRANGVAPAEVTVVPVNPSLMLAALKAGSFDAVYAPDPIGSTAIATGIGTPIREGKVQLWEIFDAPYLVGTFVLREDFVVAHPTVAAGVQRALDRAVLFIREHQSEAKEIFERYLDPAQRASAAHFPDALCVTSSETDGAKFQSNRDQLRALGVPIDELSFANSLMR